MNVGIRLTTTIKTAPKKYVDGNFIHNIQELFMGVVNFVLSTDRLPAAPTHIKKPAQ